MTTGERPELPESRQDHEDRQHVGFHDREYDVYVVLGDPAVSPPWVQSVWASISEVLSLLLQEARDRPAVRLTQLHPGPGSPNQRSISFGRVGWGEPASRKWIHSQNGQLVSGGIADFLSCEVWAPAWTVCHREHQAPDVYFEMRNEAGSLTGPECGRSLNYNSCCVLAVARDISNIVGEQRFQIADSIALDLKAVLRAHAVRPWGFPSISGLGYTNAINDLMTVGLFKLGARHQTPTENFNA